MSSFDFAFSKLFQRIEELERVVNSQSRQINNLFREGRIVEVHPDKGTAVVEMFGDGSKTKQIPWLTQAGDINDFVPPSVGQRVIIASPTGEPGRAVIMPGGYSDQFQQPHDAGSEAMRKVGSSSDLMTGSKRRIVADEIEFIGNVRITGEVLEHNGRNVGDDHRHTDVKRGGDLTGPPEE